MLALIVDVFFLSLQQGKNKSHFTKTKKVELTDGSISENWRGQYTSLLKAFFIKN